jgi:predicted DsbA family dithiol-disulfide isomerase
MNKLLKIEIISDVSCPWCIIGYTSLSLALNKLVPEISAQLVWLPFELNPQMPAEGQHMGEHLQQKYGSTQADIDQARNMITARGAALGFQFNFRNDGRIYNTFNAHRLLYWSRQFDKQTELQLALFRLYFTEGGNPGNTEALKRCGKGGFAERRSHKDPGFRAVCTRGARRRGQIPGNGYTFCANVHYQ